MCCSPFPHIERISTLSPVSSQHRPCKSFCSIATHGHDQRERRPRCERRRLLCTSQCDDHQQHDQRQHWCWGGNGDDTVYAGAGDDTSYGETLLGLLDNGGDTLYGGPGNDMLDGGNGNDTLIDTEGTDNLSGGNGNDTIVTQDGVGGDTANGGLGTDNCAVDPNDTTSGCNRRERAAAREWMWLRGGLEGP